MLCYSKTSSYLITDYVDSGEKTTLNTGFSGFQSPTSGVFCQPTPSSERARIRSPAPPQPLTGVRSAASALPSWVWPSSLRRRFQRCWSAFTLQASSSAPWTASRNTQVKSHTHTRTDCECEALDWWIGTAGCWFYWLVVYWESVVHDYMMIFPRMFLLPPPLSFSPPFQNLFLVSLSTAEDPRLLQTDPLSYDLQSPPCLTRHIHTLQFTLLYAFSLTFFHVYSFNYTLLLLELVIWCCFSLCISVIYVILTGFVGIFASIQNIFLTFNTNEKGHIWFDKWITFHEFCIFPFKLNVFKQNDSFNLRHKCRYLLVFRWYLTNETPAAQQHLPQKKTAEK